MQQKINRLINSVMLLAIGLFFLTACNRNIATAKQYYYDCPMHNDYITYSPGQCPICGMNLQAWEMDKSDRKSMSHKQRNTTNKSASGGACH